MFLQFSTVNSDLEAQADALLGQTFEEMVQEDKEQEDALNAADARIEAELEEDESNEPMASTITSQKKKKKSEMH